MKYTINELANSKGVSPLVREALLHMEAELDATNRQVEILSDALAESRREVAAKDESLKLALEALELHGKQYPHMVKGYCLDAITAIKQALAAQQEHEPENEPYVSLASVQEPVRWSDYEPDGRRYPAVPDAFGTREGEHPQYIQGWNDCRQAMMEMMK